MKVFLIGFMGCGKSTMGKRLAKKTGYTFIDLDQQLEKAMGMTIGAYFSEYGEAAFRTMESETLQTLDYPANAIVATGGGVPCFFDNIEWMNRNGLSVYIEMPPLALAKRLENGKDKRPLLRDLNETQMVEFIKSRLEERDVFYKRALLTVNGIDLTADALWSLILQR